MTDAPARLAWWRFSPRVGDQRNVGSSKKTIGGKNALMRVLGLVFAGTATDSRAEMTAFARDVLGLQRLDIEAADADMFALPDGSTFAVAGPRELGETSRSVGFLVADLEEA